MNIMEYTKKLQEVLGGFYIPSLVIAKIIGVILLTVLATKLGSFLIRFFFEKQKSFKYRMSRKKIDTLSTLFTSIFRYFAYILCFVAILTILTDTFKLTSILTAAGIGGVAIGLGAQSLIKDIISGIFIIFENQYSVGERISIDTMSGVVEEFELRVTKLRSATGDLFVIPNGEIKKVTNHSRGNKSVIVDVPVAYHTDMDLVFKAAEKVCEELGEKLEKFIEKPSVLGITDMQNNHLHLRISAKAAADDVGELEREMRKHIWQEFLYQKIEFFTK